MSNLIPVNKTTGLNDVRNNALSLFDRWLPGWLERQRDLGDETLPAFWRGLNGPAVDIEDRENAIVVNAEMPGLAPDDFTVEVEADRLVLRGEKKADTEKRDKTYYLRESSYGSFHRIVTLPAQVNRDKADANYKNGILTVTLPKTEEAKEKRIAVKVS